MDTVIIRGVNDDELIPLLEFARTRRAEIRFIEYMDVGGATQWSMRAGVLAQRHAGGDRRPLRSDDADRRDHHRRRRIASGCRWHGVRHHRLDDRSRSAESCDRSRLTADGVWYLCLYAARGVDLRGPLRGGVSDEALRELITSVWHARTDRGAETRLAVRERSPLIPLNALRRDPHLEMHTRGG